MRLKLVEVSMSVKQIEPVFFLVRQKYQKHIQSFVDTQLFLRVFRFVVTMFGMHLLSWPNSCDLTWMLLLQI